MLTSMKETAKASYDLIIVHITTDPDAPPPKGNKASVEHICVKKAWKRGECEAELEGKDLEGVPAVYYMFRDYVTNQIEKSECCMALFYLEFESKKSSSNQQKLLAVNW